jgi:hypothetical protein
MIRVYLLKKRERDGRVDLVVHEVMWESEHLYFLTQGRPLTTKYKVADCRVRKDDPLVFLDATKAIESYRAALITLADKYVSLLAGVQSQLDNLGAVQAEIVNSDR